MKRIMLVAIMVLSSNVLAVDPIVIKRIYQSHSNAITAIVAVQETMYIKCAAYDKNRNVLIIEGEKVSPPLDNVFMYTQGDTGKVKSVECWGPN